MDEIKDGRCHMKELYDFLIQIVLAYPPIFLDVLIIVLVVIRGYTSRKQRKNILRCINCLLEASEPPPALQKKEKP